MKVMETDQYLPFGPVVQEVPADRHHHQALLVQASPSVQSNLGLPCLPVKNRQVNFKFTYLDIVVFIRLFSYKCISLVRFNNVI